MMLVLCMSFSLSAFAYQSVTCTNVSVDVALHGRKTIRYNQAETHLIGKLNQYGKSGREYNGVSAAYYYGSCNFVQQHDVITADIKKGVLDVTCLVDYSTYPAYGFWAPNGLDAGEYIWNAKQSFAQSLRYIISASKLQSATISCYNVVIGFGWQGTVGAGDWS